MWLSLAAVYRVEHCTQANEYPADVFDLGGIEGAYEMLLCSGREPRESQTGENAVISARCCADARMETALTHRPWRERDKDHPVVGIHPTSSLESKLLEGYRVGEALGFILKRPMEERL